MPRPVMARGVMVKPFRSSRRKVVPACDLHAERSRPQRRGGRGGGGGSKAVEGFARQVTELYPPKARRVVEDDVVRAFASRFGDHVDIAFGSGVS